MSGDVDQERLERLRGDLASTRARATGFPTEPTTTEDVDDGAVVVSTDARTDGRTPPENQDEPAAGPEPIEYHIALPGGHPDSADRATDRDAADTHGADPDETPILGIARRPAATTGAQPARTPLGRRRIPRPPRRSPFRRRARRPPRRLAVPAPVPVSRRPDYLAPPRWPVVGLLSGIVIMLVIGPAVAQLAFRLWTAMGETSPLLGASGGRTEALRAAAGVAGGGLTLALAVLALAVVRGRPAYLGGVLAILLVFVALPFQAYTANAGITSAPLPSLGEAIAPTLWGRRPELVATFALTAAAAVMALADLGYRSIAAMSRAARTRVASRRSTS